MDLIRLSIQKPVAVTVGVILIVLAGVLAFVNIPIQLTPNVETTVVTVTTFWEGASPQEVEQEIVRRQEERLKGISDLKRMVSSSNTSQGQILLEFELGLDKETALREVSDKLREVSGYPENVNEPVVYASNPRDRDYIAWVIFETDDPDFNIRTIFDFAEDRVKPALERVGGVARVNVLGGYEREAQVRVDPVRMGQYGLTYGELVNALRGENVNISAGNVAEGKVDVRVRTVGRYDEIEDIEQTICAYTSGGPIRVGDIAEVTITYKEAQWVVRNKGKTVIAINAEREVGSNVIEVMAGFKAEIAKMNQPGGLLESYAQQIGVNGTLHLRQVYDQTVYINQAIDLVRTNIFIGGTLAIITLVLFLRSARSVGIIALAIPISVVGTFVAMQMMGRNLNVISLAGMAFAIGMVVDNAIVVLENIFRHLEMGESPATAAYRGTREVWGAVLASTLTTVVVFVPILFIAEEAGQLFRDIALAICAAVLLSLLVSVTVIPSAARRWLTARSAHVNPAAATQARSAGPMNAATVLAGSGLSARFARGVYAMCGSLMVRVVLVLVFAGGSVAGSLWLMPPSDYLPKGNRNLVFGLMIPPPGYNLDKSLELAGRAESVLRPFWEAGDILRDDPTRLDEVISTLPQIPKSPWGPPVMITPSPIDNYFFVAGPSMMFHGGVSSDPKQVGSLQSLMNHATRSKNMPGVRAFAFQAPLFRVGGSSGSSVEVELSGDDIDEVTGAASTVYRKLAGIYGHSKTQADPGNFNIPGPEYQIVVNRVRAADLGLTTRDIGLAVRALADGAVVGEFDLNGETIDLKVIDANAIHVRGSGAVRRSLDELGDVPISTPTGHTVPMRSVVQFVRTTSPQQINHIEEQRAISIEITPPDDVALETAMEDIAVVIDKLRASGAIPFTVETRLAGSADKLSAVRRALIGDGTLMGLIQSRLFLALLVVFLLMCVLFESFIYPAVILLSVPLATCGGFLGLFFVHKWSAMDSTMPEQNLDILTMLGFVILIGVVVNNAILIVHQALNFMRGTSETSAGCTEILSPRLAIAESVRTRLRPIMMSTLTSVGGMMPLVLMPGSGSELYRGLGSVVTGGLLVSTIFTLVLVPLLFSLVVDLRLALGIGHFPEHPTAVPKASPAIDDPPPLDAAPLEPREQTSANV